MEIKTLHSPKSPKFKSNQDSDIIISKAIYKDQKRKKQMNAYYSFLTVVLLFCLIQISCSAILNISKVVAFQKKIHTMKDTKKQVDNKNSQLKTELENFSSSSSWEAIARNNLKMAGDNEILVIINEKVEPKTER